MAGYFVLITESVVVENQEYPSSNFLRGKGFCNQEINGIEEARCILKKEFDKRLGQLGLRFQIIGKNENEISYRDDIFKHFARFSIVQLNKVE